MSAERAESVAASSKITAVSLGLFRWLVGSDMSKTVRLEWMSLFYVLSRASKVVESVASIWQIRERGPVWEWQRYSG